MNDRAPNKTKKEFEDLLGKIHKRDRKHPWGLIWTERAVLSAIYTLLGCRLRGETSQSSIAARAQVDDRTVRRVIIRLSDVDVRVLTTRPTRRYDGANSVSYYEIDIVRLGELVGRKLPSVTPSTAPDQESLFPSDDAEPMSSASLPGAGPAAPASTTSAADSSLSKHGTPESAGPRTPCPRPPPDDLSDPLCNASLEREIIDRASLESLSFGRAEAGGKAREFSGGKEKEDKALKRLMRTYQHRRVTHAEPERVDAGITESLLSRISTPLSQRVAQVYPVDCDATRGAYAELDRLDAKFDWVFEMVTSLLARSKLKMKPRNWFNQTVWQEIKKRRAEAEATAAAADN